MPRLFVVTLTLAIALVAVGCGSTSSVEPSPTGSLPAIADQGRLGDTLRVGPLEITPTKVNKSSDPGSPAYSGTSKNGQFVSVLMTWENVGDETIRDFPVAGMLNTDAVTYRITMVEGPTPSLANDWTDLPAGKTIEGWLTFDIAGEPTKLVISWEDASPGAAKTLGGWLLN
jgi:hypothetical protein